MRFLVTGASGMIGCRLSERLAERHGAGAVFAVAGPRRTAERDRRLARLDRAGVARLSVDLLDPAALRRLPDFDAVFHLAAELDVSKSDGRDGAPMRVNDQGTANLLDALAPRLAGKVFVYTSSVAAVDRSGPEAGRMDEDTAPSPRTLYGRTKLAGERLVRERAAALGFRWSVLRLGTIYGPDWREGHVFDVFTRWVKAGALPARVDWPGRVSLAYVDDVADVLMAAAEKPALQGETFFVANPEELTVGQLAGLMAEALGVERRPLPVPGLLARGIARLLFLDRLWRSLPDALSGGAWRLSLILCDGLFCDPSKLARAYPKTWVGAREGIRRAYLSVSPSQEASPASHAR